MVEPWRPCAFKVIKDLAVDRSAFDALIETGSISRSTQAMRQMPMPSRYQKIADKAMDAAVFIGCGACVVSCPNASAMLFVGAKVSQMALLPQGKPEASRRVNQMIQAMDRLGFGNCTNERECEAACPKDISISNIARLNREHLKAGLLSNQE